MGLPGAGELWGSPLAVGCSSSWKQHRFVAIVGMAVTPVISSTCCPGEGGPSSVKRDFLPSGHTERKPRTPSPDLLCFFLSE